MIAKPVSEMTVDELEVMVSNLVDKKMREWFQQTPDTRTLDEILADIDKYMWTPPPGAPSNLELLREDRDR